MKVRYIETSVLLWCAKNREGLPGGVVSDLVLAEVHNLDEPWRDWAARLLEEASPLCLRLELSEVEFAQKYVYNHVLASSDYPLGLHYALACLRGLDGVVSCGDALEERKPELDRINSHFKVPAVEVETFECSELPEKLFEVRGMIGRLLESQGPVRLLQAVRESQEFFQREKGLKLKRVGKI